MCSCPGAQQERRIDEELQSNRPDVGEPFDHRLHRRALRAAIEAVRRASPGKTRAEVRELLEAELRLRGISVLLPQVLDMYVEAVIDGRTGAARMTCRGLARIVRKLREATPLYYPAGKDVYFFTPNRSLPPLEVILEPGAQQWLADNGTHGRKAIPSRKRVDVWLELTKTPAGGAQVVVRVGNRPVGVLSSQEGEVFRPALEQAGAQPNLAVMTTGTRTQAADRSWHLYVFRP